MTHQSDIVARLRLADCKLSGRALEEHADALCHEAAALIETQAAEIERLRGEVTQLTRRAALDTLLAIDGPLYDAAAKEGE